MLTEADLFEQAIIRNPLIVSPETSIREVMTHLNWPRSPKSLHATELQDSEPQDCERETCEIPGFALIRQGDRLMGIVTSTDMDRVRDQDATENERPIATLMTAPVITIRATEFTDPFVALTRLHHHRIQHLPILDDTDHVIGVVTHERLLQLAQALHGLQQQTIQNQAAQLVNQREQATRDREQADAALQQSKAQFHDTLTALQASESKYRTLIDTLPDLIMRISGDGCYLDFFPSCTFKVLGSADIVKQGVFDGSLPMDLAKRRMHYIERALQTKSLQIYEQQLVIEEKLRTEEVRVTVCGENEVLLIVRDITDRKEAENALIQLNQELEAKIKQRTRSLKESEERFRQIFEQSPLGIAITDLDGYVVRANTVLSATLGYFKPTEVLGLSIQELLHVEPTSQGLLPLQQLLEQTLSVISFESQPITRDGRTRWVNVTSALIFSSNFPSSIIHLVEDITERKQSEQQLRNLSARLSLAVQAGDIGIWEWNVSTNELEWSGRMYDLYGVRPSDFTNTYQDWFNRIHPEDQPNFAALMQKALQNGQELNIEFRIICPDDTIRFIKASGLIQRDRHRTAQRIIGVNFDITRHKQTEAVISNYAREVEDLYNNAPCGYHSLDAHGRLIKINDTALHWLGYTREETLGKNFEEFLTQQSREAFRTNYAIFKRQNILQDVELDLICKDGSIFPVLVNASAVTHADGTYLYSRSTLFDHRKLKAATASLKRQLVAIEAAVDGIAIIDQGGYTYLNRAHLELFGYDRPEELIGRNWTHLYASQEVTWVQQHVLPHLRQQGFWQGEVKAIRKDQSTFIQGLSLTLTENGEIICVCRDITERKQAEDQLQKVNERLTLTNAELYRATRLRDEFLANMSHELRTPLNAILGMAESLQEDVFGTLNQDQTEAVTTIAQSGSHLLELINDILDLSKAEACRLELQIAPTSIPDLCQSSLAFVKHQAIQKNLQLIASIPQASPDIVLDERRIRQVLINLLTNAIKFTPSGGTIQLVVQPEFQTDQHVLRFSVIDTGIGIAPDDLDKLFRPFSQIDSSLNRQHNGTGLGLALVRRLVELHRGTVSVTSTLGQGSCFTVCLPYVSDAPTLTSPVLPPAQPALNPDLITAATDAAIAAIATSAGFPPSVPSGRACPLILLAEDNEANIITTTSYLKARGYETILARNGMDAVAIAEAQLPDLILMDIQMPQMDGLEAMKQIRHHEQLQHIPIIALTALAMPGDRDKCLAAGANDYCTKPVKLKQLIGMIRNLLNQVSPPRSAIEAHPG